MIIRPLAFAIVTATLHCNTVLAMHNNQAMLDEACEDARQVALQPRKKEIFQECINKFKKSEATCQEEAQAYNGNRIGGAPLYYELPACVKAFENKKHHEHE